IGRWHPAWRIHSLFGRRALRIMDNAHARTVSVIVTALEPEFLPEIAVRIGDIDGAVSGAYPGADPPCLTAEIYPESVFELASLETVRMIEERGEYYALNDETQEVLQSGWVASGTPVWDAGIHGEGQILGHMDSGVDPDHCFFHDPGQPLPSANPNPAHRKIIAYRTYAEGVAYDKCENGHGTHTAGTAAGYTSNAAGIDYIGMAYAARMTVADVGKDDWLGCYLGYLSVPSNLTGAYTDAYTDGARIHTNSWGSTENTYDAMASQTDTFMWNHKDFLIFYAIGNSGPDAGTMGTPATAKNIVAVGGCLNEPDQNTVWSSSSRGPVSGSGRMAPALMAPSSDGTGMFGGIDSSASDGQTGPLTCGFVGSGYQGTSMACPAAAGSALLVRQYFTDGYYPTGSAVPGNGFSPSAALMKAVMINGAANMTNASARPNSDQGWGRVHLDQSLFFAGDTSKLIVHDVTAGIATGGEHDYTISVQSASEPLRITAAWTDAAGNFLVNDLDLELLHGGTTWIGNNFQNGWSTSGATRDRTHPVECIFLNTGTFAPGQYVVRIRGYTVPSGEPGGLQPYALAITGDIASGSPPTPTPTPDPPATRTPVPSGTPTFTPTPVCDSTGVFIEMPDHHFTPGETCFMNLRFCNISDTPAQNTPVFVILDAYGLLYFAPGWTSTFDHYTLTIAPGTARLPVLPEFTWPAGTGSASGLTFYAAMTDPAYRHILGEYSAWEFAWSE
ncbi:MAG TPA: S8 family serine peptidase, partial [bacterium]|nr:S8 family serine peptidase [bacterium]